MVGVGHRREVEGMTYFTKPSFRKTFRKLSNAGSLPEMNPTGYLSLRQRVLLGSQSLIVLLFAFKVWLDEHGCPVGTALPQLSVSSLKPRDCEFGES